MARQLLSKLRSIVAILTIGGASLFLGLPIDCDPGDEGASSPGSRRFPLFVKEGIDPNNLRSDMVFFNVIGGWGLY